MEKLLENEMSVFVRGLDSNFAPPFKLRYREESGRGLVATRDIKVGQIIMEERPAVFGPKASCRPRCHICGRDLGGCGEDCEGCGQPFCNRDCSMSQQHQQECQIMKQLGIHMDNVDKEDKDNLTLIIVPLRCLLMNKISPIDNSRIHLLKDHLKERQGSQMHHYNQHFLLTLIRKLGLQTQSFSDEDIHKVCAILDSNAFENKTSEGECRGLWPLAAMANSSCLPNTTHIITKTSTFQMIASRRISEGEEIFVCYTGVRWGRAARRKHLVMTKYFSCGCVRCDDNSEAGTYVSSLVCPACAGRVNEQIMEEGKEENIDGGRSDEQKIEDGDRGNLERGDENAGWVCEDCRQGMQKQKVGAVESMAGQLLKMVDKKNPGHLERLATKLSRWLSINHYILLEIYITLIGIYQQNSCKAERIIQLVDQVAPIIETLEGRSRALALLKLAKIDANLKIGELPYNVWEEYEQVAGLLREDGELSTKAKQVEEALQIQQHDKTEKKLYS